MWLCSIVKHLLGVWPDVDFAVSSPEKNWFRIQEDIWKGTAVWAARKNQREQSMKSLMQQSPSHSCATDTCANHVRLIPRPKKVFPVLKMLAFDQLQELLEEV